MDEKLFDTTDLSELRKMIGNKATESFDLDDILSEFGGTQTGKAKDTKAEGINKKAENKTENSVEKQFIDKNKKPQAENNKKIKADTIDNGNKDDNILEFFKKENPETKIIENNITENSTVKDLPDKVDNKTEEKTIQPETSSKKRFYYGRYDGNSSNDKDIKREIIEVTAEKIDLKSSKKADKEDQGESNKNFDDKSPKIKSYKTIEEKISQTVQEESNEKYSFRERIRVGDTSKLRAKARPYPRRSETHEGFNEIGDISKIKPEENIEPKDPKVATKRNGKRAKSLRVRSRVVFICMLIALVLSFSINVHIKMPSMMDFSQNPVVIGMIFIILHVISLLLSMDILFFGIKDLIKVKPTLMSALFIGQFAVLITCLLQIFSKNPEMPYTAVSLFALFIALVSESDKFAGKQYIYKVASLTPSPVGVFIHKDEKGKKFITKGKVNNIDDFLIQIETPDGLDKVYIAYSGVVIIISVVLSALAAYKTGTPINFLRNLAVILTASVSFSMLASFGLPYKSIAKKLLSGGAAVASIKRAELIKNAKSIIIKDGDIFPAGTVSIEGFRVFDGYRGERVLAYAAAAMSASGSETYRVFAETLRERYGTPVRATNVSTYESGGVSVTIRGDNVWVGTASFVMRMGIRINEGRNIKNGVFVIINGDIAGIFALKYKACASSYGGMQTIVRSHKIPIIASKDFNITPPMVEDRFDIKRGMTEYPDIRTRNEMCEDEYTKDDILCGILSRDGVVAYSECVKASSRLSGVIIVNLIIGILSGILGLVLTYFLAATGSVTLNPINLFLYLILWYIPTVMFSKQVNRPY